MNTCGTCKYFGDPVKDENVHVPTGYHVCAWVKQHDDFGGATATESAVVVDGSGYFAALCVKEDFGCNKWESRS